MVLILIPTMLNSYTLHLYFLPRPSLPQRRGHRAGEDQLRQHGRGPLQGVAAAGPQSRLARVLPDLAVSRGSPAEDPLPARCAAAACRGARRAAQLPAGPGLAHLQPVLQVGRPQPVDHHAAGAGRSPGGGAGGPGPCPGPQGLLGHSVPVIRLVRRG